jgi:hypothetical protein
MMASLRRQANSSASDIPCAREFGHLSCFPSRSEVSVVIRRLPGGDNPAFIEPEAPKRAVFSGHNPFSTILELCPAIGFGGPPVVV